MGAEVDVGGEAVIPLSPSGGALDHALRCNRMSALVSAVAGRPIRAGRLVRDIGDDAARALSASSVAVAG